MSQGYRKSRLLPSVYDTPKPRCPGHALHRRQIEVMIAVDNTNLGADELKNTM